MYNETEIREAFLRWEQAIAEEGVGTVADTVEQRAADAAETLMGFLRGLAAD